MHWTAHPVFVLPLAGSRPRGRPPFLLRQERRQRRRPDLGGRPSADSPALLPSGGRRRTRPAGSDSCAGLPRLPLRCSAPQTGCGHPPRPAGSHRHLQSRTPGPRWENTHFHLAHASTHSILSPASTLPITSSQGAVCPQRPSEPPSSTEAGGEVRRGCLSRQSRRVPRRPPDSSSAGESSAPRTTGEVGSPSLPTFLAKQESRSAAGPNSRPTVGHLLTTRPKRSMEPNNARPCSHAPHNERRSDFPAPPRRDGPPPTRPSPHDSHRFRRR